MLYKKIKNEINAILTGFAAVLPIGLISKFNVLLFPWIAGREAGIGAYKMEQGGAHYEFASFTSENTFEGYALRGTLKNAWNETKGVGVSLIPGIMSIPALSAMSGSGPEPTITSAMAYSALAVHVLGGYTLSRIYSKNVLAPHYAKGFEQQWLDNNPPPTTAEPSPNS